MSEFQGWRKTCLHCTGTFRTDRSHARFCSNLCCKRYHRAKHRRERELAKLRIVGSIKLPEFLPIMETCWACLALKPEGATCPKCGAFPASNEPLDGVGCGNVPGCADNPTAPTPEPAKVV